MTPFLTLVLAAFSLFVGVLGYYSTRDLLGASRPRHAVRVRQVGTALRIQAVRESPSSGFSRT